MTEKIASFSLDDFDAVDTSTMTVMVNGAPTDWKWTFAGPGHPKAIEQSNRLAREGLAEQRAIQQARANGKKWKASDETPDELRRENVGHVVERLVGWSPVKIDGKDFAFSSENATMLLADPKRVGLLTQALEFLADENSFTRRSATN
ncbi:hypothetical protein JP74_21290 [Devosia sp. 17-2-E-8]|nr:hypothetical protein JP74_21290 [Devosia sp. 17-2-E-8]